MQITDLRIRNFKSIKNLHIADIENALILVGQNNTGKTAVLDAVRAVSGDYQIQQEDFLEDYPNIEIMVKLRITQEDLTRLQKKRMISPYRNYASWYQDFCRKLPSYQDGILTFEFVANRQGRIRYSDGYQKNNISIPKLFPRVYYIDAQRKLDFLQENLLLLQEDELLKQMRSDCCMFDRAKTCTHCFSCIGYLKQKTVQELNAFETARLLDYKLYQLNLNDFSRRVNERFRKNGGKEQIFYSMNRDIEKMLSVTAEVYDEKQKKYKSINSLGKGMRSIYMLSLLETYVEEESQLPSIIVVEYPELFLHPRLQKTASEILYRLSKKNQVIFSTHSPQLLLNFTSRQIRQVVLDEEFSSVVRSQVDIGEILDDLGYGAGDAMNVDFVFIVEGRQDKSRLPLLLKKYYSEVYKEDGSLSRVSIITTNSCTNIKTYANLKYMNQVHFKDQFLMIRDGDGKDRGELKRQLCRYYEEQGKRDVDHLPRVTEKNVLILRYYSFENYFLNPEIMTKLSVVPSEEVFYDILYEKWREYLCRLTSGKKFKAALGRDLKSPEDLKEHMDLFKIHLRGHNLFDIFYGRYKKQETELLSRYIDLAPREDFADILDSIDQFLYFDSRKKKN